MINTTRQLDFLINYLIEEKKNKFSCFSVKKRIASHADKSKVAFKDSDVGKYWIAGFQEFKFSISSFKKW